MAWTAGVVVLLLVGGAGSGYAMLRHFNDNIHQYNLTGLLGKQPADVRPEAQNILLIGSGTPNNGDVRSDSPTVSDQTHTLMVLHIQAHRKWAELMSIPTNSWVRIPSCEMGNGRRSAPTHGPINQAFAIGNRYGHKTRLGVACLMKTVEQDTGIYLDHFILVNLNGLHSMVAALNGIRVCVPKAFTDPLTGFGLSAGCHWLDADKVVDYVQARYGIDASNTRQLIGRQQALAFSLIHRAESELYNPLAIYRFVDAVTRSLTIDDRLGGVTGLVRLALELHSIPLSKIRFLTVPFYPRSLVVPSDTVNVLWKQPQAWEMFASLRFDVPFGESVGAFVTG